MFVPFCISGRLLFRIALVALVLAALAAVGRADDTAEFFEKKIRPVLVERCYKCHSTGSEKLKGGLHVDSREGLLKGGDTRPAIVPGQPEKSLLIEALTYQNPDLQMPPKERLSAAVVADFAAWIKQGALWPGAGAGQKAAVAAFDIQGGKQNHWAWQALRDTTPPATKNSGWPKSVADRYLLAALEAKGLRPAPAAARETLLRRASFDLTGLPPTPAEIAAFVNDSSADAFARVVDRLLDSTQFGERWARHWLDLVRYAETRGHEFEPIIPNAWQYRDYVIRALNTDVPYDDFVREHLAGDLLPKPRLHPQTGANESILGTGFWFLGEEVHSPVDIRADECDRMDNRLDVMTKTFLGLTVACARCHDHKFDAISQKDYYALTGFLISGSYRQARFETLESHRQVATELAQLRDSAQRDLLRRFAAATKPALGESVGYLAAAIEMARAAAAASPRKVDDVAAERLLDRARLERWSAELTRAKDAAEHPLHPVSRLALAKPRTEGKVLQAMQTEAAAPAGNPPANADVVVDYTQGASAAWYQDGFAFGSRPLRAGEARLGAMKEVALDGVITEPAAYRDPVWKLLRAPKNEKDHGKLGQWDRSEQTLRTPSFTIGSGTVWYLVRGAGRAYAAVNSHLIIAGPLHNATLTEWRDTKGRWQWVSHNLGAYKGSRCHVELSPADAGEFAVAMVVQGERPALPFGDPNALLVGTLAQLPEPGASAVAQACEKLFARAIEALESGRFAETPEGRTLAHFADFMVRERDLFLPAKSAAATEFQTALQSFSASRAQVAARIRPESQTAPAMFEGSGTDEFLLVRGSSRAPREVVPRRFLEALSGPAPRQYGPGSGRLELATEILDPANPFTSRVIVNRVWHHLFGRGIVPTVDNFGVLGQPPSHRELLDRLALDFMREQRWSVKKLIRSLMLSSAYQMSSQPADAAAEEADPENLLLHRANVRRLEGEAIRDALLAVSGRLQPKVGGPSVPVHLTAFMDGRGRPGSGPLDGDGRRSIYISVRRNFLSPMMLAFDAPIPFTSMGRRNVSNVPAQALILMNDPFVLQQARMWADRILSGEQTAPEARVTRMYLTAFGRSPTAGELADAVRFTASQASAYGNDLAGAKREQQVWADLAHVLFNVKEFIYLN